MYPFAWVWRARWLLGTTLAASAALVFLGAWLSHAGASGQVQGDDARAEYSDEGVAGCLECHNTPIRSKRQERFLRSATDLLHTPHSQSADARTPFAAKGCETCHGPSRLHNEEPKIYPVAVVFGTFSAASPPETQNKVCLGCHEGGLRWHWQGSSHQSFGLSCAACHDPHKTKDPILVKRSQPEVCLDCHTTVRAQIHCFSRHPIKEGKVVCADCHNPHGSTTSKMLREVTVNDTCYQCHAEKRGPLLWEHPPVRDKCTNCHTPHGSSQPRLLKTRPPYLCQQCHQANFHPSTLYSGTGLPSPAGNAASRLLMKSCLNCHSQVHGSNHPAGARFTR